MARASLTSVAVQTACCSRNTMLLVQFQTRYLCCGGGQEYGKEKQFLHSARAVRRPHSGVQPWNWEVWPGGRRGNPVHWGGQGGVNTSTDSRTARASGRTSTLESAGKGGSGQQYPSATR